MRDCIECGGSDLTMNKDFLGEELSLYRYTCATCGHGGPGAFEKGLAQDVWDWHIEEKEQEQKLGS